MELLIDTRWLLEIAEHHLPDDPQVTDWGAFEAARARHAAEVMGRLVYDQPHHRAAALLHSLVRVPSLESGNELLAASVAVGYLHASGRPVRVSTEAAADLVERAGRGLDVRAIAAELKAWTDRD
ncbi:fic family toxin-antitoxin system, toxin component [Streptomyces sp. 891-h]|uniref:fic family toxin-antitoxin system, toxin component n=1 Tax=Streptomyces sp. 891-h TaxID=2720714 RepID=UPI001FAB2182|nr:fic family toxin-antitoxin system, toxin component [Streptomyces sp. 891-h]UNZ22314.1 fic family toxin-antitoxin system, toxin component [Streptomyces sp. 891-h]